MVVMFNFDRLPFPNGAVFSWRIRIWIRFAALVWHPRRSPVKGVTFDPSRDTIKCEKEMGFVFHCKNNKYEVILDMKLMEICSEKQLEDEWGSANALSPSEIIRMLTWVKVRKSDVFYDLGSGHGRVVRMAITHGHVKKAVGIEHVEDRFCRSRAIAKRTLSRRNLKKIEFLCGDIEDFDISDVTVVYEGHNPFDKEDRMYRRLFKNKRVKIIKRHLPLVGYIPADAQRSKIGSWFFLMKNPLGRYRTYSKSDWICNVLNQKNASTRQFYKDYEERLRPFVDAKGRKETIRSLRKLIRKYLPND